MFEALCYELRIQWISLSLFSVTDEVVDAAEAGAADKRQGVADESVGCADASVSVADAGVPGVEAVALGACALRLLG